MEDSGKRRGWKEARKMKRKFRILIVFLLAFLLAGCGDKIPSSTKELVTASGQTSGADAEAGQASGADAEAGQASGADAGTGQIAEGDADKDSGGMGDVSDSGGSTAVSDRDLDSGRETPVPTNGNGNAESTSSLSDRDTEESGLTDGPAGLPDESAGLTDEPADLPDDLAGLTEDGAYTSKEDVAGYLYLYGHLPSNFITKKEAEKLGWEGGSLEPYAPGMCIGGNRFGNYEGILPEKKGRSYTECDIDTLGADKRGAKRIVFSNDGLIYYTEDHYNTFELLYGEPEEE